MMHPAGEESPKLTPVEEFMALYTAHHQRLYLYVMTLVADPNEAGDVFQEINLVLWRKFAEFQPGTNFFAWASQVARYKVLQHRKRYARQIPVLDAQVLDQLAEEAGETTERLEDQRRALLACLERLRPRDRELIELRYAHGATGRAVAEQLNRPENSVYISLSRVRRSLLDCIRRRLALSGEES